MSRIGRMPVDVPQGVDVVIKGSHVRVKGPKGQLEHTFPAAMDISMDAGQVNVKRPSDEQTHRALHGMTRALINNMVVGVSQGFEKVLEVNGVGYRAELSGQNLVLNVGYSHPIEDQPARWNLFRCGYSYPNRLKFKVTIKRWWGKLLLISAKFVPQNLIKVRVLNI